MTQMKQFMVFAFGRYYPAGGLFDFHSCWDTLQEAQAAISEEEIVAHEYEFIQIYDRNSIDVWYWDYTIHSWLTAVLPFKGAQYREY